MFDLKKNILITGGLGFIGTNLIELLLSRNPDQSIVNIDKVGYASSAKFIKENLEFPNYSFVKGDISDQAFLYKTINSYKPDVILHLAAESHVDNSIKTPEPFIQSNILGTFNVLEVVRTYNKKGVGNIILLHVSTDEVYGSTPRESFTENSAYAPNSPYSASKASSDLLVRAYNKTYGLETLITHCGNNYGPFQHHEKLIPTIIKNAIKGSPIPIYGDGLNVRNWIFVKDHCNAILRVLNKGKNGETYNIGSNDEVSNIDLTKVICGILDQLKPNPNYKYSELITFVEDRAGHDFRYSINSDKIKNDLGWASIVNLSEGLEKTIAWYLNTMDK